LQTEDVVVRPGTCTSVITLGNERVVVVAQTRAGPDWNPLRPRAATWMTQFWTCPVQV
jgi:hypothetical protein